jgi:hypothetical protein
VQKPQAKLETLLRGAFSDEEREFLSGHPRFQRLLAEYTGSLDDFERLAEVGHRLIEKYYAKEPVTPHEKRKPHK